MKRVLLYSQDGLGLGHLRRSSNIGHEILSRDPECNGLILADSPASSYVPQRPGLEVLKLPTIVKTGRASARTSSWHSWALHLDIRQVLRLRASVMLDALRTFAPDVFLIDHMPLGALGELKQVLDHALALARPPRLLLGLRDVLEDPAVIREAWSEMGVYDYLHHFETVLIYGRREIFDAAAAYDLERHVRRIEYCNYVSPPGSRDPLVEAPARPYLLMTGGGGHDAFPLAAAFLDAQPIMQKRLGIQSVLLAGPTMPPVQRKALLARANGSTKIVNGQEGADGWVRRAAAVITMGGYNSMCEVLQWQKKALIVPRDGPSEEQITRAQLFERKGLVKTLEPAALTPERLVEDVESLMAEKGIPDQANIPPLDGASRAAEVVLEEVPGLPDVARGANGFWAGDRLGTVRHGSGRRR
jgi:predicted glycosyltransferase